MEFKQIQELLKNVNKSNISEVSIKNGDFEITIKQANTEIPYVAVQQAVAAPQYMPQPTMVAPTPVATPAMPAAPATDNSNTVIIKSPMIGTFYRSAGPDKAPFVGVGDDIKPGSVICIVEAMKLFNEIESEISGKIVKVLVDDASPVEYDQPLFLVEPA
jgi:acetyl-CoA carboxylase biotin carboxyl carrier protein